MIFTFILDIGLYTAAYVQIWRFKVILDLQLCFFNK
jgi:hypothetical protein